MITPAIWPVWWNTGLPMADGFYPARVLEARPYRGAYPQWFNTILRLHDPNTRKGWSEMAVQITPQQEDTHGQIR